MSEPENSRAMRQALRRLLDTHGERLHATLARLTLRGEVASELFQELFIRLDGNHAFAKADDPTAYAFRAAINLAMEWRRKRRADVATSSLTDAATLISSDPSPLQRIESAEQYERLLNALSELSESAQRLFVLRFIEEQSYEVIARQLGTTPHRARGLCHAAVRQLRKKLSELHDHSERIWPEKNHVSS